MKVRPTLSQSSSAGRIGARVSKITIACIRGLGDFAEHHPDRNDDEVASFDVERPELGLQLEFAAMIEPYLMIVRVLLKERRNLGPARQRNLHSVALQKRHWRAGEVEVRSVGLSRLVCRSHEVSREDPEVRPFAQVKSPAFCDR